MTKNIKRLSFFFSIIILFFVSSESILATDEDELIKKAGFTYSIKHPNNQLNKEKGGALNLKMTEGQKQTVLVEVENLGEEELILDLSLNGARTNSNGGMEHGPSDFSKDESMVYDLPELVTIPSELVIPLFTKTELPLEIKMPEVAFDGIVTGGVEIKEREEDEEVGEETTIINRIAYLFGVTLRMTDKEFTPELALKKIYPEQANYRNAIYLDVANLQPMKLDDLVLDIEITKKNQSDVLYQSKKSNMEMAPNTVMNYPVSLSGERMIPGEYTAHVLGSVGGEEFTWEKDFTISNEEADSFNQKDVSLEQDVGADWKKVAAIVAAVLIIILFIYFIIKGFGKKKQQAKRQKKRKRKEQ